MARENLLTEGQIKTIHNIIGQAFAEEVDGPLTIDINFFKSQVDLVVRQMKLEAVFHSNNEKIKGYRFFNQTARKRSYAARGYLLIFKFRQWLLNEEIDYRYYYSDNEGHSHEVSFTEDDILRYMKFGNLGIQLNQTLLKEDAKLDPNMVNKDYNDLMDHFFTKYTQPDYNNYMKILQNVPLRVVRKNIFNTYASQNPGLINKKTGRYQAFTKGHIYEAIDSSISQILQDEEVDINSIESSMEQYTFGRYLAYDNIKASKGGDNALTNTSIKSNSADLYDFGTIKSQLESIQQLLNGGTKKKEDIQKEIIDLFLHKSKFASGEEFNITANDAVDKLLNELQNLI